MGAAREAALLILGDSCMPRGKFLIRRIPMAGVEAVEAETDPIFPKRTHEQFGIGVMRRGVSLFLLSLPMTVI